MTLQKCPVCGKKHKKKKIAEKCGFEVRRLYEHYIIVNMVSGGSWIGKDDSDKERYREVKKKYQEFKEYLESLER